MGDWRGFSPQQMAGMMGLRASRLRGDGAFPGVPTTWLLDEGADLIVHQAAEIERLRDALDPFQWHVVPDDEDDGDDDLLLVRWADVRRALAALTGGDDE